MSKEYPKLEEESRPTTVPDPLRAIAYLLKQDGSFRFKSPEEQGYYLGAFGLSESEIKSVLDLYRRAPDFNVLAPPRLEPDYDLPCPIGWPPGVTAPVFYGFQDLDEGDCAPAPVRVWYPSLDGSPDNAPVLAECGPYPLVVFLHGQCLEQDHYKKWYLLPAQLARAGYVVVVQEWSGSHVAFMEDPDQVAALAFGPCQPYLWFSDSEIALIENVTHWMRNGWYYRSSLMPDPNTAFAGHSYGALMAGVLTARARIPASAYVSLSGVWTD